MHTKFCPNCGHKVLPDAKFCGNCGYQFGTHNYSAANQQFKQLQQKPVLKNHHYGRYIIIAIIILLICGVGYASYQGLNEDSHYKSVRTSRNSVITKSEANTLIKGAWNRVKHEIIDGSETSHGTSLSDYFTTDNNSSNYSDLSNWAKDMRNDDDVKGYSNSIKIKSIHPVHSGVSKVNYMVKYTFNKSDGNTTHQGFIWHAKLKKVNGTWLICHNVSNKKPVYNRVSK